MPLYLLLLLFSCRASSHFLPLKNMPFLQGENEIIEEIICLLDAEKSPLDVHLKTPNLTKNPDCARNNTEQFIHELSTLNKFACMNVVREDMKKLRDHCSILKKKSAHENSCTEIQADFSKFKHNLEDFLKWLSQTSNCGSVVRKESEQYAGSKCHCPHPHKYRREQL